MGETEERPLVVVVAGRMVPARRALCGIVVADIIEATDVIPFQNPLRRSLPCQEDETLRNGIGDGAIRAKSVGVGKGLFFRDGQQGEKIQRLHGSVEHGRDSEGSEFPIFLRYIKSTKRPGMIRPALGELLQGLHFLLMGDPSNSVHPGGS